MAQFMLLIRSDGEDDSWSRMSPEEMQQEYQRYFDWSDKLRRAGQYLAGEELKGGGKTVRQRDGRLAFDGPFAETKEAVGGYYLIEARDEDEAARIAGDCPSVRRGGVIEVREINVHERPAT